MERTETNLNDLTARQIRAITALLSESSIEAAARKAKVSKVSIYRWLETDVFNLELQRQRSQVFNQVLNQIASAMGDAMKLLDEQVNDTSLDPGTRQRAAAMVLRAGARFKEFELETRLTRLEERIANGNQDTESNYKN